MYVSTLKLRLAGLALALAGTLATGALPEGSAAAAPLVVNIDNPNFRKLITGLPEFTVGTPGDAELERLAKEGPAELGRLLSFSGLFNIMDARGYADLAKKGSNGKPLSGNVSGAKGLEGIDLTTWKGIGIESLTVGELTREEGAIAIALRTADVNQGRLVVGKKYTKVTADQFKKVMARYADRVLEAYTGKPGIFSTKLVFVGKARADAFKQIYMADFDGTNVVQLTSAKAPHLSPSWSPDGRFVTYTSFEDGNPDLYIYEVATGKRRKLSGRKGINSGANWSHNGKVIAFTGSVEGDAEIYTLMPDGSKTKALIRGSGLDVDPTFSPDGKWMAFVSGRFGNPHIFRAELKWESDSDVRVVSDKRLTYAGWYNATPAWSPESDKICFAGYDRDIDRFDLFLMNPDGTALERLTIRMGDNERPSFSPNGQMIVFQSNRTPGRDVKGPVQLWLMNRDGSTQRQLNTGLYDAQTPQWGPPLE
jgi:TolB protein